MAAALSGVGASAAQANGQAKISRLNNPARLRHGKIEGFMIGDDRTHLLFFGSGSWL
jgi:hypothetical protein